jgi:imidazole glycerol-phosphate synthase subunit HisH
VSEGGRRTISLVDYGAGNLASVCKAFAAVGGTPTVVSRVEDLGTPDALVVPGVGHFGATAPLDEPWRDAIRAHVAAGRPLLGICLGMQWLFEASEEAPGCSGLGLLAGTVYRMRSTFPSADGEASVRLKIPHVGWNRLAFTRDSAALAGVRDGAYVYFTHSYAAPITEDCVAATTHGESFAAVVERGVVWGAQFHPEKSSEVGLQILRNFVARAGQC